MQSAAAEDDNFRLTLVAGDGVFLWRDREVCADGARFIEACSMEPYGSDGHIVHDAFIFRTDDFEGDIRAVQPHEVDGSSVSKVACGTGIIYSNDSIWRCVRIDPFPGLNGDQVDGAGIRD